MVPQPMNGPMVVPQAMGFGAFGGAPPQPGQLPMGMFGSY
jgi:hypothetical protein